MSEQLIRIKEVLKIIHISRAGLYRRIDKGEFRKPLKIGSSSLWKLTYVMQYINLLEKQNDSLSKN